MTHLQGQNDISLTFNQTPGKAEFVPTQEHRRRVVEDTWLPILTMIESAGVKSTLI